MLLKIKSFFMCIIESIVEAQRLRAEYYAKHRHFKE